MTTMHEAEAYLRNPSNPSSLHVRISGKKRRIFINRDQNQIGIIAEGKRNSGYLFCNWSAIEKIYYPTETDPAEEQRKLLLKYQKLAKLATFTNHWLKSIAEADPSKSLYENHITTGVTIEGQCIRLSTIEKHCGPTIAYVFRDSMKNRESYHSPRFDFNGYDGSLWCEPRENGGMIAGFSKEYRGCGNGYYYLLINDDTFIGYDID